MAKSIETRIEQLESAAGGPERRAQIGVLTVDARESWRAVAFRLHGFYLEPLGGSTAPGTPRVCRDGIDVNAVVAAANRMVLLYAKLDPLDRASRAKLAMKNGFRVVYPLTAAMRAVG